MKKMFAAAAMLALLYSGAACAQGVTITEENPRPPRTYRTTDLESLLKQEFEITIQTSSASHFKFEFGERRYGIDRWTQSWVAEFTLVPMDVELRYSWIDEKPSVLITLFSRQLDLRVNDSRKAADEELFLGSRLGVSVSIQSFPTSKLSLLEIEMVKDAVRQQKPLRFKGTVRLRVVADTLSEFHKRMNDITFTLEKVEKVEAAEGKPASKAADSPICEDPARCPF